MTANLRHLARRNGATPIDWAVRASSAVFGLSLAIALAPSLQVRASATDAVSALRLEGLSPRGPVLQFLVAVLLTAAFAIAGERIARMLAGYRWAQTSYCAAALCAPVTLMYYGNWRHVALLGLAAAAIVALRRRDPNFTREDVILLPAFLACCIAFLDAGFGHTPVATASRAAVAVFAVRLMVRNADAFILTPLALFAQLGWFRPGAAAAIALVVLLGAPLIFDRIKTPAWMTRSRWTAARLRRNVIYPLIIFLYPLAVLQTVPPFAINFFEDSHGIPVATEMMRGERPYTDIVPTHGLITDGVLDLVGLKIGGGSLRTLLVTRLVAGVTGGVAIYCLILAATGAAGVALAGTFLAFFLASGSALWLRPAASLFALAAVVAATRLRSRKWFMLAGALVVLAWLVSIDFGLYTAIVALFAAFRSRALRPLVFGIAAAALPSLVIFAVFGFALDFIRVSFGEILGGHGAYFVHPLWIPDCLRSPAVLHHIGSEECIYAFTWIVALIATCAAFARSPLRGWRSDAPWLIGVWIVVAAASFVERGNYHFYPAATPLLVVALFRLSRQARTIAVVLTVALVLLAQPFRHVITVIPELRYAKPLPLFDATSDRSIRAARHFVATLKPADTFVDFSNSALLYSLVGRDCPLRTVEVANYQTVEAQRDVIDRISANRHIRAALIAFPGSNANVDGIPNRERAPMVWSYLQRHFTPAFEEEGVIFWSRID